MDEYQEWREGLGEADVEITHAESLDGGADTITAGKRESRLRTSLLYGDNDVIDVIVIREGERFTVTDAGECSWTAEIRHFADDGWTAEQRDKGAAIATRWNVLFENGEVVTKCDAAAMLSAVKRVALAAQEIEAAAEGWK